MVVSASFAPGPSSHVRLSLFRLLLSVCDALCALCSPVSPRCTCNYWFLSHVLETRLLACLEERHTSTRVTPLHTAVPDDGVVASYSFISWFSGRTCGEDTVTPPVHVPAPLRGLLTSLTRRRRKLLPHKHTQDCLAPACSWLKTLPTPPQGCCHLDARATPSDCAAAIAIITSR